MKKTLIVAPEAGGHCPFYLSLIAEAFTHENCKILAPEKDREVRYHLEQRDMNLASFEFIKPALDNGPQPLRSHLGTTEQDGEDRLRHDG